MLSKKTIDKIMDKGEIVIGRYTYKVNYNTGKIFRCLTEEIGKEWFGFDGERHDGWSEVK